MEGLSARTKIRDGFGSPALLPQFEPIFEGSTDRMYFPVL
jgi:hypothetical protein